MNDNDADDETQIRRLIENWAIWRDIGDWDRLATTWRPEGHMVATWFEGPAAAFIAASRDAAGKGTLAHHVLGGTAVRIQGRRALADTRMTLHLRSTVENELCDIACLGRFFDLLEKGETGWGLVLRQPIYEKDRLDWVRPDATVSLDQALLDRFPAGYRHLAYAQARAGLGVNANLPGAGGVPIAPLYSSAEKWLGGADWT